MVGTGTKSKTTKASPPKSTDPEEIIMVRSKTTVGRVATALEKLQAVQEELKGIDLRTTRGVVRDEIREARTATDTALQSCAAALQADAESLRVS